MLDSRFIVKDIIKFSLPVLFGLIGMILISTGDTLVAARYSTTSVAALSVAGGFHGIIFLFGIGLSQGISPKLSYRLGRGEEISTLLYSLIFYGLVLGLFSMLLFFLTIPWLNMFGFDPKIIADLSDYLFYFALSNPFAFIFVTLKEYYQVHNKVFYPNLLSVLSVGFNLALNIWFAFGYWFVPEMGLKGIAIASILVRGWMVLMIVVPLIRQKLLKHFALDWSFIKETFYFSLPLAFAQLFESSAFSVVAIFVGKIGMVESAANGIAFNIIALAFMVPLTLSIAMTVRIGRFFGADNPTAIKQYVKIGVTMTLIVMAIFALIMVLLPTVLVGAYSQDPSVIAIGASILLVCAIFQLFDGMQCLGSFVLRGLGISKPVMTISFFAYWIFAIPLGLVLARVYNLGVVGHWLGLVLGLFIAAFGYWYLIIQKLRKMN